MNKQIKINCATCGKEFFRHQAKVKRIKHGSFCSPACHYAGRSTGATKRVVTKAYTYTPEGIAAQKNSANKAHGQRVFHWFICDQCGKQFDDKNDGRKRISGKTFCSLPCCNKFRKGENNPSWSGGYPGYYGKDWRQLRRDAWKRDDFTCQNCGKIMKPPSRRPDVHHIKPVHEFSNPNDANYLDNVICLCHTCHMLSEP